jgi:hypothetical protein
MMAGTNTGQARGGAGRRWRQGGPFLVGALTLASLGVACGDADEQAIVAAIEAGVDAIKELQKRDGSWNEQGHPLGETALAGLALVAGGQRRDHPDVRAAVRVVRKLSAICRQTYDIALAATFLDVVGDEADSERIRDFGRLLAAGQCEDGSWSYQLDRGQRRGDNSNTQFAALACWICRRHGTDLNATLGRVDGYFRDSANQGTGGWGYRPGDGSTASMTCAGLVALAARQGLVFQKAREANHPVEGEQQQDDGPPRQPLAASGDPVVSEALVFLGSKLGANDGGPERRALYFCWSLERVGVIYGINLIDGIDWYEWGSRRLLGDQLPDGSWEGKGVETSFAVLFLARANVAADLTTAIEGWAGDKPPSRSNGFLRVDRKGKPPSGPAAEGPPSEARPAPPPNP